MADAADLDELKLRLIGQASSLGFAAVGFAPAADDPLRARRLREWLAEGHHGTMEWMEARADVRQGPNAMWPEARSVIALGMSYAPDLDPLALDGDRERARISVYAQGQDYHDTVKKALKALARWLVEQAPGTELKVFVDTAPVMEKPLGEAAGIGPLCSIVRYEMQRRASSLNGSGNASVGHTSWHARHDPQRSACGTSGANGSVV